MRDVELLSAGKIMGGIVAATLAADVVLIVKDRESISCFCGRHFLPVVAGALILFAHFKSWPRFLQRFDPFDAVARKIRPA